MSDFDLAARVEEKPITKPPTRWKNRWVVVKEHIAGCTVCGARVLLKTDEICEAHCKTHPSKDLAETYALCALDQWPDLRKYLGAFPLGGEK